MRIETIFLPRGRCTLLGGDADATTTLLPRETGPLIKRAGAKIEFAAPCVEALGVQGLADRRPKTSRRPSGAAGRRRRRGETVRRAPKPGWTTIRGEKGRQWRLADAVRLHAREAVRLIAAPAGSPSKVGSAVMPVETRSCPWRQGGFIAVQMAIGGISCPIPKPAAYFIKHEANVSSGGRTSNIEIGEYLVRRGPGPEHQELLRLIGTLVEDPSVPNG